MNEQNDPLAKIQAGLQASINAAITPGSLAAPTPHGEHPDAIRPKDIKWAALKEEVKAASAAGEWDKALKLMLEMSNNDRHPEAFMARVQSAWLVVKIPAPVTDVTLVLFDLLASLEANHPAAGGVAALANLMAMHRTPDHPQRELAQMQAQQMWPMAAKIMGINPDDNAAFEAWRSEEQLDDPNAFIPRVMGMLERMGPEVWWIDRERIQAEMMQGE
ncbi:hypothetical protein [Magnetofaba australis]|uniref:Uncharacterized protein n=1 Tax=Magnetofaba australis IT-1 TaxID=1434232 RepID=A0A1Y2K9S4_9PROT|nr:hypothetical protein [Magnetofaba australis]OSM06210.1 hypothetical protein MAIT1_01189 [Magnetofaba australis IT-1]